MRAMFERYREWSESGLREAKLLKDMKAYRDGLENFGKSEGQNSKEVVQEIETLQERSREQYRRAYANFENQINEILTRTDLDNLATFQQAEPTVQKRALAGLGEQNRAEVLTLLRKLKDSVAPHLHTIRQVKQKYEQFLELNPSEQVKNKFLKELEGNDLNITFKTKSVAAVVDGAFEKAKELQSLEGAIERAKTAGAALEKEFELTLNRINPETEVKVLPQEEANFVQVPDELARKLHETLTTNTENLKKKMDSASSELVKNPSQETLDAFTAAQANFKREYHKVKEVFQAVASQLERLSQNYSTTAGSEDLQKACNLFSKQCGKLCEGGNDGLVQTLQASRKELEQGYKTAILAVLETHPNPTNDQLKSFLAPLNTLRDQLLQVTQESVTKVTGEISSAFKKEEEDAVPTYLKKIRELLAEVEVVSSAAIS